MNLNTGAAIAGVFITLTGFLIDHWQTTSQFFEEYIWHRLVVNLWFVWAGLIGYGIYWFVQFLRDLRRSQRGNQAQFVELQTVLEGKIRQVHEMLAETETRGAEANQDRAQYDATLLGRLNRVEAAARSNTDLLRALSPPVRSLADFAPDFGKDQSGRR